MATLFKLGTRGYHATVKEFQGQIRVHIRKYTNFTDSEKFPTKHGIALTIEEFEELKKVITDMSDMAYVIVETIQSGKNEVLAHKNMVTLFKLGTRGYHASVKEFIGQIRVHIRKYIDDQEKGKVPTYNGVALTMKEFEELKKVITDLSEMLDAMVDTCSMTTQPGEDPRLISSIEGESLIQQEPPVTENPFAKSNYFWEPVVRKINKKEPLNPNIDVYIGRRSGNLVGSKWQNSFKLKDFNNDRDVVLKKYLEYMLYDRKDLLEQLHELSGKRLVCYCAPLPCHGDVLVRLFNFYLSRRPDSYIQELLSKKETEPPKKKISV